MKVGSSSGNSRSRRIVLVALLIAAMVIGSAVIVWWQTSGDSETTSGTPVTTLTRDPSSLRFVISEEPHYGYPNESTTVDITWDEVGIRFMNDSNAGAGLVFVTSTEMLIGDDGQSVTVKLSPMGVVSIQFWVNCTVTDQTGNGRVNEGDSFTLVLDGFTLEPGSVHTAVLEYCATGLAMAEYEWTA